MNEIWLSLLIALVIAFAFCFAIFVSQDGDW
jgi:hypothetical protein